jgi:hypothetical protein
MRFFDRILELLAMVLPKHWLYATPDPDKLREALGATGGEFFDMVGAYTDDGLYEYQLLQLKKIVEILDQIFKGNKNHVKQFLRMPHPAWHELSTIDMLRMGRASWVILYLKARLEERISFNY